MTKTPRPRALTGQTIESSSGCGPVYVTINDQEGRPFEVFVKLGKSGGCSCATTEALGKMISIGLRSGTDPQHVAKGLAGIQCHKSPSCLDAVAGAIREHVSGEEPSDA